MTFADHIEEEIHLELSELWMLPLLTWRMICAWFAAQAGIFREARLRKAHVRDWEDHLFDLALAEWNIAALKSEGARRLLAGEDLDYASIPIPEPPAGWLPPVVEGPQDLLARFEAVTRFHADPEAAIRAHVARIVLALRDPLRQPLRACHLPRSFRLGEATRNTEPKIAGLASLSAQHWGRWMCAKHADGGGLTATPRRFPP